MNFASDNTGPVHPKVMEALSRANDGFAASYGKDEVSDRAADSVREVLEAPDAVVHFVVSGTAANCLALASLAQPWDTIFAAPQSHIYVDENNGVEAATGGARVLAVGDQDDRITAAALKDAVHAWGLDDVHSPTRGPVSITNVTERGTLYAPDEIAAIADVAAAAGVALHMDGARFANAVAALDVTPAAASWRAGVDVLSFGGTKNGAMAAEAVVFFDPAMAETFERRRMRAGHLLSKARYVAAQILALLEDDLWLDLAKASNGAGGRLAAGLRALPGVDFPFEPQANMLFVRLPRAMHRRLKGAGAVYGLWEGPLGEGDPDEPLLCRLVCDWSCDDARVDRFLGVAAG